MKTRTLKMYFFVIAFALLISACTKPIETPVKASTLGEYISSVSEIAKYLDEQDREIFLYALEIVSVELEIAVMSRLDGFESPEAEKIITDAAKKVDGLTPVQIITKAANKLKPQLLEMEIDFEGKTDKEILKLAKSKGVRIWQAVESQ